MLVPAAPTEICVVVPSEALVHVLHAVRVGDERSFVSKKTAAVVRDVTRSRARARAAVRPGRDQRHDAAGR
jgi:hypothetical protein